MSFPCLVLWLPMTPVTYYVSEGTQDCVPLEIISKGGTLSEIREQSQISSRSRFVDM